MLKTLQEFEIAVQNKAKSLQKESELGFIQGLKAAGFDWNEKFEIPDKWKSLFIDYDPEYEEYLRLREKFGDYNDFENGVQ